jgi:quercetin dioxygenase-like cupin family protein
MQIEALNTSIPVTKDYRSSDCTLLGFNLPSLIATMKKSFTWANGDLNALILLKSPHKQVILTAMHEGTEIKSFQSNDSITFQIIEGKLKFHIRKDTVTLNEGQLMTLNEKIKYSLTTQEETVFLLTISDSIARTSHN